MSGAGPTADRVLDLVDRAVRPVALYAGGLAVIGLASLVVVAVVCRYVFNAPIFGADDFNQILLVLTVAFSIGYSGRTGGQVVVEILGIVSGPKLTRWTDIVVKSAGCAMIAVLVWMLVESGVNAAKYGETTLSLELTLQPLFWALAFGMALYGLVLMAEIVALIRARDPDEATGAATDL